MKACRCWLCWWSLDLGRVVQLLYTRKLGYSCPVLQGTTGPHAVCLLSPRIRKFAYLTGQFLNSIPARCARSLPETCAVFFTRQRALYLKLALFFSHISSRISSAGSLPETCAVLFTHFSTHFFTMTRAIDQDLKLALFFSHISSRISSPFHTFLHPFLHDDPSNGPGYANGR